MRDDGSWNPNSPSPDDDPWGAPPDPRTRRDGPSGPPQGGNGYPPDNGWDAPPRPYGTPSRPNYPPDQTPYAPQGYPPPQQPPYPPPQRPSYPPQRPDYPPMQAPGYEDDRYGPPQRPVSPQWSSPTPSRPRPPDPNGGYGPQNYGSPSRGMADGSMERAVPQHQGYAPPGRYDSPPARWDPPAVHDMETDRVASVHPPRERERAAPSHHGPRIGFSLPIEHIVLAAGVLAMYLALSQPWGMDPHGQRVFLDGVPRQAALYATLGLTGLGGALVLLNKRMGCFTLLGCLGLFVIPLLVAATVGGFTVLTQLHVIPKIAISNISANNRGFYLWWGGMAITMVGLVLQLVTHRRKGLIGI